MNSEKLKLFAEFSPVSTEEWMKVIIKELKGADFEKKLVWKTLDKFKAQPFYREENLQDLGYLNAAPGAFPYARGTKPCNDWEIRQNFIVDDVEKANKKAVDAITTGVDAVGFVFADGIPRDCVKQLLKNISPQKTALHFNVGNDIETFVQALTDYFKECDIDKNDLKGSIDFDPLRYYMTRGKFCVSQEKSFDLAKTLIEKFADYPQFRVIGVSGITFKNAGVSITQEIAFALAVGVEYLNQLTERGLKAYEVAKNITFNLGITASYFPEIAKFRAARLLWANIVKAFPESCDECAKMHVHAETSFWNMSIYDPYVNMLRTTTEAMSAALGGVDALTVKPFDAAFRASTAFSERIARNQQIILKEESRFNKVADVSAGSYFIENLTNDISEEAWNIFMEVEDEGGFMKALQTGRIQERIKEMQKMRMQNVATRREIILGTNQFPNFTEKSDDSMCECARQIWDMTIEAAEIETIKPFRMSLEFDNIRLATDKYAQTRKRPVAFMLTIGNLSMRTARSQFASNFFACAGYEIIDNNGFSTVDEGVKVAFDKKADIVVLCSSDEEYAEYAPEAFDKVSGKAIFVVAGNPVECIDALKAKGIVNFIHVRSNVLEMLQNFNRELGI
ncbi:MAG: methylmalonyl-CoA mutase family protein [Bacteroidales bacterium]|jgi:methylmalonyl-CoA mutase|nr:methylmalonyl-CoA mutase family protein [Bacteroidales bacterium]